jgi:hypothetical protein
MRRWALRAQLFGRRTYEFLAARWPSRRGELADRLNSMPKYVVSSTLEGLEWNNTTVLKGDAVEQVSKLKQELRGEIVVAGSIQLARADRARPRRRAAAAGLSGRAHCFGTRSGAWHGSSAFGEILDPSRSRTRTLGPDLRRADHTSRPRRTDRADCWVLRCGARGSVRALLLVAVCLHRAPRPRGRGRLGRPRHRHPNRLPRSGRTWDLHGLSRRARPPEAAS